MFEIFHSAQDKSHLMILDITLLRFYPRNRSHPENFMSNLKFHLTLHACMQDVTVAATHKQVLIGGA